MTTMTKCNVGGLASDPCRVLIPSSTDLVNNYYSLSLITPSSIWVKSPHHNILSPCLT